jgi:hypothetical protein
MQRSSKQLPKILFVNDFSPDSLAVADLVRQLLLGYPREQIAWWYSRNSPVRGLTDLAVGELHCCPLPNKMVPNRRLAALRGSILERIWVPIAARHLKRIVSAVKPDIVWVLLFGWPILVARKACLGEGVRLHVSLWDIPDTKPHVAIWGKSRADRFLKAVYWLIQRSASFDGISHAMLEEIAIQTGRRDGILVHSGFEPEHLSALSSHITTPTDNVLRLAYVGTIISERAFLNIMATLGKLRSHLPRPLKLEFFGARGYGSAPWFNSQWMLEHGVFSDRGLVEALQRCDWGIVVTDPEAEDVRYSRYSFPNKIGTYLSAGVPILAVGHKESALAEIMKSSRVGVFSTEYEGSPLEKFLAESLRITDPRSHYRDNILECASTEFNANEIRGRLWNAWMQSHQQSRT